MGRNEHSGGRKKRSEREIKKPRLGHYLIVTDTEQTEKNYFEGLIRSLDKESQKDIHLEVKKVKTADLVEECLKFRKQRPAYCQCWIVFDRDEVPNFDEIIHRAKCKGIGVAWSNPCMEIWFYACFRTMKPCETSMACCHDFGELFHQKTGQVYTKADRDIYRKLCQYGDETMAIERAEQRAKSFFDDMRASERCPCSMVYELVREIKGEGVKI